VDEKFSSNSRAPSTKHSFPIKMYSFFSFDHFHPTHNLFSFADVGSISQYFFPHSFPKKKFQKDRRGKFCNLEKLH
jgi:hypothetical protein